MSGAKALRLAATIALLGSCAAAYAEDGEAVYSSPDQWFAVEFPAAPTVEAGIYPAVTPSGETVDVPAKIYSYRDGNALYQVTVASLANSAAAEPHALDYAVAAYRRRGTDLPLDTNVSHSLANSRYQLCGRHFGYEDAEGRLNYSTLYYNPNTQLFYDVVSLIPADHLAEHGAAAARFQQSLALQADPASVLPDPPEYPASWQVFGGAGAGFDIRFPAAPTVEQGSYTTEAGVVVPATRYSVRQSGVLYRLTVGNFWDTAADSANPDLPDPIDQAVVQWIRQGSVAANDSVAISGGQCGRDITLQTPGGTVSRASLYFPATQHRLYIVEVARDGAEVNIDPEDDRRFRQSLNIARAE